MVRMYARGTRDCAAGIWVQCTSLRGNEVPVAIPVGMRVALGFPVGGEAVALATEEVGLFLPH